MRVSMTKWPLQHSFGKSLPRLHNKWWPKLWDHQPTLKATVNNETAEENPWKTHTCYGNTVCKHTLIFIIIVPFRIRVRFAEPSIHFRGSFICYIFNQLPVANSTLTTSDLHARRTGPSVKATSAKEYTNMINTPGHKSQYRGEGVLMNVAGSLNDKLR